MQEKENKKNRKKTDFVAKRRRRFSPLPHTFRFFPEIPVKWLNLVNVDRENWKILYIISVSRHLHYMENYGKM